MGDDYFKKGSKLERKLEDSDLIEMIKRNLHKSDGKVGNSGQIQGTKNSLH